MSIRQARLLPAFRQLAYRVKAKRVLGTNIVHWPLSETSGTTMTDVVKGWNGTYTSVTLANGTSPTGKPWPLLDLAGYAYGLGAYRNNFPGSEGGIMGLAKAYNSGVWSNNANCYLVLMQADANNLVSVAKDSANYLHFTYKAGGTTKDLQIPLWQRDSFHWAITWSKSNDRVRFYVNGAKVGELTGLGTWAGVLASATVSHATAGSRWNGWQSDVITMFTEVAPATIKEMAAVRAMPRTVTVLGDSISVLGVSYPRWPVKMILDGYNGGWAAPVIWAVGGHTIVDNLAAQVTAASNDNADDIIIHMGTNDVNTAENAVTIQATLEQAFSDLKTSNPKARIFFMQVLDKWTNNTGLVPVDRSYIKAAIVAACATAGVPCWDTSGVLVAAKTTDGTHPTEEGHADIAAFVLGKLQA